MAKKAPHKRHHHAIPRDEAHIAQDEASLVFDQARLGQAPDPIAACPECGSTAKAVHNQVTLDVLSGPTTATCQNLWHLK